MPVFLKDKGEYLAVTLGGFDSKQEFSEALGRVKSVPGKRANYADGKFVDWQFPRDPETALRIMLQCEPVVDAAVQAMIREHQGEVADALISAIDKDAVCTFSAWNTMLFPYQRAYVDWTQRHPRNILADEMGIGKTIQAYGAWREWQARDALHGKSEYSDPALVIVPNGQRNSWRDELIHGPRYIDEDTGELTPIYPDWPGATVRILTGGNTAKRMAQITGDHEVYITNWEKLRSDAVKLGKLPWGCVIADEAHRAKNWKAQQTKGLWKLHAPLQLALTGTPVMNSPAELWPLLSWMDPETYSQQSSGGGYWAFHYSYVDDYATKHGRVMKGLKNVDQLRFELTDKLVRRTKKVVMPDLPEKLPGEPVPVDFTAEERKLYAEAENSLILDVAEYIRKRVVDELGDDADPQTAASTSEDIADELAHIPIERLSRMIPNGAARVTLLRQITGMAKARIAVERILDERETPIVTFTWFVDPAKYIVEQLAANKVRTGFIGGAGGREPSVIAKEFQQGQYDQIVCTIAKGGTGLDLFRASHAIFADRDWVPEVNNQALDRLHRKGQKNAVSHDILYVPDSVDDKRVGPANAFKEAIVKELGL